MFSFDFRFYVTIDPLYPRTKSRKSLHHTCNFKCVNAPAFDLYANTYLLTLALVLYEYLVTLRQEIEIFWLNFKLTAVSLLFISTRIVLVLSNILNVAWYPTSTSVSSHCRRLMP